MKNLSTAQHPRSTACGKRRWAGGAIYSFKSSLGDGKHRGLVAFSVGDEDGVVVRAGEDGHVAGTGSGLDEPGAEAGRGVLHQEEVLVARPAPGQEDGLSPQGPAPDGVEEGGGLGVAV